MNTEALGVLKGPFYKLVYNTIVLTWAVLKAAVSTSIIILSFKETRTLAISNKGSLSLAK